MFTPDGHYSWSALSDVINFFDEGVAVVEGSTLTFYSATTGGVHTASIALQNLAGFDTLFFNDNRGESTYVRG